MYKLSPYQESNRLEVLSFMRRHPFVLLTGVDKSNQPVATQVPVLVEERDTKIWLVGHLMKNTDHHKAFEQNSNVLCVFTGPHAYVSATWYANPHQASTWNYLAVHAKGTIRFTGDEGLKDILQKTTLHFENGATDSTTVFGNLPEAYTARLLPAIVGFAVEVTALENVFKLSQNRDEESYQRIMEMLAGGNEGARTVAGEMQKRKEAIFGAKDSAEKAAVSAESMAAKPLFPDTYKEEA